MRCIFCLKDRQPSSPTTTLARSRFALTGCWMTQSGANHSPMKLVDFRLYGGSETLIISAKILFRKNYHQDREPDKCPKTLEKPLIVKRRAIILPAFWPSYGLNFSQISAKIDVGAAILRSILVLRRRPSPVCSLSAVPSKELAASRYRSGTSPRAYAVVVRNPANWRASRSSPPTPALQL